MYFYMDMKYFRSAENENIHEKYLDMRWEWEELLSRGNSAILSFMNKTMGEKSKSNLEFSNYTTISTNI